MTKEKGKTLTVLLPALNEENAIGDVIDSIPTEELAIAGYNTEILIVDGHSTDRTMEIARHKGAGVIMQSGRGKGFAVRTGFEKTCSDFLIMLDADGTYPSESIPAFLSLLENGADVVMGSRLLGQIERGSMSDMNRAGNRLLSFMASQLYGKTTTDICTGMWGFNRKAIQSLRLNSHGFEIEAEMFAQATKASLAISEIPINYGRRKGEAKLGSLRSGMNIALKILRKRFV